MENNKEIKSGFIQQLLNIWWILGVSFFSVVGFLFGILSFYKLFDGAATFLFFYKFLFLYVVVSLLLIIFLMFEQILSIIRKQREKRKKEFIKEVSVEIKKELKSKK